tara:strand:+ start:3703 stop:3810 length:108 start_codon:yes stop_codon:yes gene_type:complete
MITKTVEKLKSIAMNIIDELAQALRVIKTFIKQII